MYISGNQFINNRAINNSAVIYMKEIEMVYVRDNRFEGNQAQYGSCLYSVEQNSRYNRSIVTDNNQFVNNRAYHAAQIYY